MIHHRLTSYLIISTLLSACATIPTQNQAYREESAQAKILMSSGQHKQAAQLYQNLAKANPEQQNPFRLLAAEALIQSGDSDKAKKYADSINLSALSPEQRNKLIIVYAQISLNYGNAEQALEKLNNVNISQLGNEDQQSYYRALAFAHSLTGNLLASAKTRIKLSHLLSSQNQRYENYAAILETLGLLPLKILTSPSPTATASLDGWMALAKRLKQNLTHPSEFDNNINEWRQNFPNHPANSTFLQDYLALPRHAFTQPAVIAVLLPESGPFEQAAKTIREGLLAAYYQQQNLSSQPAIRFYDSAQDNPVSLYNQAVASGAELIIGPLNKENIVRLAADSDLNIPVLALNHVENLSKANLYQFGLSPIDDAQQITEKAYLDGHRKALLLTPATNQGRRIANYLSEYWQQTNGTLLESQSYNPKEHDFSYPIKNLLNLDESQQRYQQLRQLLSRRIEFVPRRRHDVDAIFINAHPWVGRSLNPQFRFYHATRIPIYATARIYSGRKNPSQDIDLNNITFCDIPWLFADMYKGELSQESLRNSGQPFPDRYLRLFALGIDAYNLVAHLNNLDTIKYHGATGNLLLNSENRIVRQLNCAKFTAGIPVSSGFLDAAAEHYQSTALDTDSPTEKQHAE